MILLISLSEFAGKDLLLIHDYKVSKNMEIMCQPGWWNLGGTLEIADGEISWQPPGGMLVPDFTKSGHYLITPGM